MKKIMIVAMMAFSATCAFAGEFLQGYSTILQDYSAILKGLMS